jgi:hypothetical protein
MIPPATVTTVPAMSAAHRLLAALLVSGALAACGGEGEPKEPPDVNDTAFGDMVEAKERAQAVEDTTMQHKQDLDRALDDAESSR